MRIVRLAGLLALVALPVQAVTFYSVGTADLDGGYWRVAQLICRLANEGAAPDSSGAPVTRCSPETTAGSIYNLLALADGQLGLAMVQSDWQRHAYLGTSAFAAKGAMPDLRSVMSLYAEPATLLVREGARIEGFEDLAGMRMDLGPPSSGRRATLMQLMAAQGMSVGDFASTTEMPAGSALEELCAGRIDATLLVIGHPNAAVARVVADCGVTIVPLTGPAIDALTVDGDMASAGIQMEPYGGSGTVQTIAVRATIVALARTDPAIVADVVDAVLGNLDRIRRDEPLLAGLTIEGMRSEGLTAPLHPAAEAAFAAFDPAD